MLPTTCDKPKPKRAYPPPRSQVADNYDDKVANDEDNDGDVQQEHDICEQLILQRVVHREGRDGPVSSTMQAETVLSVTMSSPTVTGNLNLRGPALPGFA